MVSNIQPGQNLKQYSKAFKDCGVNIYQLLSCTVTNDNLVAQHRQPSCVQQLVGDGLVMISTPMFVQKALP